MPHWNCDRCATRLYSASKTLKRQSCPVCQGRLIPEGDAAPSGRFEKSGPVSLELADPPVVQQQVDVPKNL